MITIMSQSLFHHLSALGSSEKVLGLNQVLFLRGDSVSHIFLVISGAMQLVRHQNDGASLVLQRAGPQTILAEASLFSDRYHCDAVAVRPSRLRAISVADTCKLLRDSGVFAEMFALHLARQVQNMRARAEILSLKTVARRLDAWLMWNECQLPPKGRWKELAFEIGVSPEALYREIAKRRD